MVVTGEDFLEFYPPLPSVAGAVCVCVCVCVRVCMSKWENSFHTASDKSLGMRLGCLFIRIGYLAETMLEAVNPTNSWNPMAKMSGGFTNSVG